MTQTLPNPSESFQDGTEAPRRPVGRPAARPKTEPATLAQLSPSLQALVSRRGLTFFRGREAFTLNDRELRMLTHALADEEKP